MIKFDHLNQLAHYVSHLTRFANWQLKSRAVVSWEFDSLQSFAAARAEVEAAIVKDPMFSNRLVLDGGLGRSLDDYTWEADFRDITIRLTCYQVMEMEMGNGRRRRMTARDVR